MVQKLRERSNGEDGFTLVELLVVMLILGLLAAIAIPSFFNQRDKAKDADAKASARTAQTAIETFATDNNGSYTGADYAELILIEQTLNDTPNVADATATPDAAGEGYEIVVESDTGTTFSIERDGTSGQTTLSCSDPSTGGCNADGEWG